MRIVLLAMLLLVPARAPAEDGLAPGTVLDAEHAPAAQNLLPPETLAHYQAGEYRNAIAAWPATPPWEPAFGEASAKNAGRLSLDEKGTIVEGGKPARGLYGLPFKVDPTDAQAGLAVIWNAYYAIWRNVSTHDVVELDWIGRKGIERQAVLESRTLYYEGVPPARAPKKNDLDLAAQQFALVTSPADLNGTATLQWRFRDPRRQDQSWTYIPALKRVRQVSPVNRSDGFLGSDLSQDDGSFFDGKPEDFVWKLVGEREQLVLADPVSLASKVVRQGKPDGAIEESWPVGQKVVGYQDPAWRGLAWAPVAPVLVQRKLWVVEAQPRDPNYLFHKIEIGIDQETFQGATSRKFDAQGAQLRSLTFLLYASQPIEAGGEKLIFSASSMGYIGAENLKANRATVVGTVPPGAPIHVRRGSTDPDVFALERLGAGK
ncbi:MAG: outer membrane lipoprotein-sorting protein [Candidatus Binatia bacterium]